MHIHLPKPLHGWRAFLGEIGIIVIGVGIALAAEQVIQALQWRGETARALDALHANAASNLASALFRQGQQRCVSRRLDEIGTIFVDHAAGRPIALAAPLGKPIMSGASRAALAIATANQSLAHLPLDQQLEIGGAFDGYANLDAVLQQEQAAWLRLDMLDSVGVLQDGDWPLLHQAYAEARAQNARVAVIVPFVLHNFALGQRPPVLPKLPAGILLGLRQICSPVLAAKP